MEHHENTRIRRLVDILYPHTKKSNMAVKHGAMLIRNGKPVAIGYNHDRMTCRNKTMMSYHAEIHALRRFIDTHHLSSLHNLLNDTERYATVKQQPKVATAFL